jgi:hypothetical protein
LLYWVIWITRRYYQPEFDKTAAKQWMPDVVLALRHDVDNRREPRLGLWDQDRFIGEIDWLDNYVVDDWSTGLVRRRVPEVGDPPGFTLAAHWAWLMTAVRQVVQQAGLPQPAPGALEQQEAADTADETPAADAPKASEDVTAMPGGLLALEDLAGHSNLRARVLVLNSIRPYATGNLSQTTALELARAKYGTRLDDRPALLRDITDSQLHRAWNEANKEHNGKQK